MHRRCPSLFLAFSMATALTAQAQQAREIVAVDTPASRSAFGGIAADGDVSAIVYVDYADNSVRLVVSDGRGLDWSAPVRVDQSPNSLGKQVGASSVAIHDGRVYVSWLAGYRNGTIRQELFMNSYDTSTGALSGERQVDLGVAPRQGAVLAWDMAIGNTTSGPRLHFATSASGGGLVADLAVTSTDDQGATFATPRVLTTGNGSVEFDRMSLAVLGNSVHVAWGEVESFRDPGRSVRYARSQDGGATFDPIRSLDASGAGAGMLRSGIELSVTANLVAAAWVELAGQLSGTDRLHVNVSTDGGSTFTGDRIVGQYARTDTWIHQPRLAIDPDVGTVLIAWADYRGGNPSAVPLVVFASVSRDGGGTWSPDARLSPQGGVRLRNVRPRSRVRDGRAEFVVLWDAFTGPNDSIPFASLSVDGGTSWQQPVPMHPTPLPAVGIAHAARYDNYIVALQGDGLFAGGFRVPTLQATGWTSGSAAAGFDLSGFGGPARNGLVLLALQPGDLPLPDGRNSGLTPDALLFGSLSALTFLTPMPTGSSGRSPTLRLPPLPPVRLHAAALSFTNTGIEQLTDVIPIDIR